MNEPPQTGKRIVSKGEYVKAQRKRASMFLLSTAYVLVAMSAFYAGSCLAHSLGFYSAKILLHTPLGRYSMLVLLPLLVAGIFAGTVFLATVVQRGVTLFQQAKMLDPGIPLTRANAADLPAPDSLVRASAEPMEAQEAVLLRAARGQETPPEQLVWAVNGPE